MDFFLYALENPVNLGSIVRASIVSGLNKVFFYDNKGILNHEASMQRVRNISKMDRLDQLEIVKVDDPVSFVPGYRHQYITTLGKCCNRIGLNDFRFERDDSVIVFGNERMGVPREIGRPHFAKKVSIPHDGPDNCHNLATAYSIFLYEYLRQNPDLFPGRGSGFEGR